MIRTLSFLLCLLVVSLNAYTQQRQKLVDCLGGLMKNHSNDKILNDSSKTNNWFFKFPKKNGDVLVSFVVSDIKKEIASLKKDCRKMGKDGDITSYFEVKTYVKGKIISILEMCYFDCNMPSPVQYENTYNYMFADHHIYKITFKESSSGLNRLVDSIVHASFDKECLNGVTIGGEFDLFIDNGLFIGNPLHMKCCNENIEIKNGMEFLEFTEVKM